MEVVAMPVVVMAMPMVVMAVMTVSVVTMPVMAVAVMAVTMSAGESLTRRGQRGSGQRQRRDGGCNDRLDSGH